MLSGMKYRTDCLGRQKTEQWARERESRILSCLVHQDFAKWSYIDLRLKEEFFRDLIITMNPWAKRDLYNEIKNIVASSKLNDEIKSTITIERSELEGTVNI